MNNLRPKENEIIGECGDERRAIGIRPKGKPEQQESGVNPRQPFDFYGQNKKNVDDFVRIKSRECEEQGCDQHSVRKIATEEKGGDSCADHPYDEIEREPERAPCAFETFADKPEKPEGEKHPQWTES